MDKSEIFLGPTDAPTSEREVEGLRRLIVEKLTYATGRDPLVAGDRDWFVAAALALRDRIVDRWLQSTRNVLQSSISAFTTCRSNSCRAGC